MTGQMRIPLAMLSILFAGKAVAMDCANILPLTELNGATCSTYLGEAGAPGTACHWSFSYRDAAAIDHAQALQDTITTCHPGQRAPKDTTVNHPDSYDLWEWNTARGIFAVSVKDKAALQKTLVFLRFERALD